MIASVGRIVHYFSMSFPKDAHDGRGPGPYAAIVTQVRDNNVVDIAVFGFSDDRDVNDLPKVERNVPPQTLAENGRYWRWPRGD